jgi:aryl-alcohol dehydrogenase-like predicted oxidoreductase
MELNIMKLCLGTVQFGMNYGIGNKIGKVEYAEVEKILDYSVGQNICFLDTAQAYEDSENILGNFNLSKFKVITKMINSGKIESSLKKLKQSSIYGVLLHNENEINADWSRLEYYKSQRLVEKIGVSVYSPNKLSEIIKNYSIDIVQLPLNILDQRFLPLFKGLKERNIEIHVRSVFLQGLLLMEHSQIPDYFNPIKPILNKLPHNKLGFALNFVKNIEEIDRIIVGVTSKRELEEICTAYNRKTFDYSEFSISDENMINPVLWRYK